MAGRAERRGSLHREWGLTRADGDVREESGERDSRQETGGHGLDDGRSR